MNSIASNASHAFSPSAMPTTSVKFSATIDQTDGLIMLLHKALGCLRYVEKRKRVEREREREREREVLTCVVVFVRVQQDFW